MVDLRLGGVDDLHPYRRTVEGSSLSGADLAT
jgi:hypothetical protein